MRALVTGATGFIGSNLVKRLLRDGHKVIALGAAHEQALPDHTNLVLHNIPFYRFDWEGAHGIDAVFHQAAITDTRVTDRDEMMRINNDLAYEFIENALNHTTARIVYASSCAVYGKSQAPFVEGKGENPVNEYGESKLKLDQRVREGILSGGPSRVVGLRYSNVFGPGESHKGKMASMIYQIGQQLSRGEKPKIFSDGEQKRDFIYIDDVVSANVLAGQATAGGIVNCGSGVASTFNDMVSYVQRTIGTNMATDYIHSNPFSERFQMHTECDMTLAHILIGFKPRHTLKRGISKYHASGALTAA